MEMTLCKPCAVAMEAEGKKMKTIPCRCEKITCGKCGRRRFGVKYEVTDPKGGRQDDNYT